MLTYTKIDFKISIFAYTIGTFDICSDETKQREYPTEKYNVQ
jgi:hypothetical protein